MNYYLSMLMARIVGVFKSMPAAHRDDDGLPVFDTRSMSEKSGAGIPCAENNWGSSIANIF